MMKTALRPSLNLIESYLPEHGTSVNVNETNVVTQQKIKLLYQSLIKGNFRSPNSECKWKNPLHLSEHLLKPEN